MFVYCISSDFSFHFLGRILSGFNEYEKGYYFYYIKQSKPADHFYYRIAHYLPRFFNIKACNMLEAPYMAMSNFSIIFFADIIDKEEYVELERWISGENDLKSLKLKKNRLIENILKCMTLKEKQVQLDKAIIMLKDSVPKAQIVKDNIEIVNFINEALEEKLITFGKEGGVYSEKVKDSGDETKKEDKDVEKPVEVSEKAVQSE